MCKAKQSDHILGSLWSQNCTGYHCTSHKLYPINNFQLSASVQSLAHHISIRLISFNFTLQKDDYDPHPTPESSDTLCTSQCNAILTSNAWIVTDCIHVKLMTLPEEIVLLKCFINMLLVLLVHGDIENMHQLAKPQPSFLSPPFCFTKPMYWFNVNHRAHIRFWNTNLTQTKSPTPQNVYLYMMIDIISLLKNDSTCS